MRVAVLSDTHLSQGQQALDRIWPHIDGVDLILHAGDVTRWEVVEALRRIAPVEGVAGNCDTGPVAQQWPSRRIVELGPFRVGMHHGVGPAHGAEVRALQAFPWMDAIIFGHTHLPHWEEVGGVLLLNPGSPTEPRGPYPSLAILEVGERIEGRIVRLPAWD